MELSEGEKKILSVLRNSRRPMKVSSIAERGGMKIRTTYYLLNGLIGKGLVDKNWEGYFLKRKRSGIYESVYIIYGLLCVLISVPLNNTALTIFGSISIILGKLAERLERLLG